MKPSKLKSTIIVAALIYLPFLASAWGVIGHRVVGQIAESYLKQPTRKAIKQILGNETLAMAANWADFIKSDTSYNYLSNWHYVNLPEGLSKTEVAAYLDKEPGANIYNKTTEMITVLKNANSTADQKKFALRLLVHLIGDVHQPMHTARKADLGGNKIQLTWFGTRTNLHRVWDEQLISFQELSYTEYTAAINFASTQEQANYAEISLKDIIFESYEVCNKIYASGIKNDDKLSYRYNFDWVGTANNQLLKGGIRLAKILNDIYK